MLLSENIQLFDGICRLASAYHAGMGLNPLLTLAYESAGLAIHIIDNDYRLIAYNQGMYGLHSDYDYAIRHGRLPDSRIELLQNSRLQEALYTYDNLYLMWGARDQRYYLTALIYVNGVAAASFAVAADEKESFKYYEYVRLLHQFVTLEFQYEQYSTRNEDIMQRIFFKELLENSITAEHIQRTLPKMNWTPADSYQLVIVAEHSGKIGESIMGHFVRAFSRCFFSWHFSEYKDRLVVLLDSPGNISEEDWNRFMHLAGQYHLLCGVSEIYHELSDSHTAYGHGVKCLAYLMNGAHTGNICRYSDCMYYILYDELSKSCNPAQFFHTGVEKLYMRDQQRHTSWFDTLEAYLDDIGHPERAAEKLHIHRNTLFYRINRMQELYNLNLDDGLERMHIMLTAKLMRARCLAAAES